MMMMRSQFATTTSLRLLLIALAVSGTSAIWCDLYDKTSADSRGVSTQEEVDALYAGGCTEIYGALKIATNYTGRLYLPNVTYISHGIWAGYMYKSVTGDYIYPPTPLLTSIELPDLNNTYTISINNAPALKTVSFPSLTLLNGSLSLAEIEDCSVDFPSLTKSQYLGVTGNMTSLNFPLLAITGFVRVSRTTIDENAKAYWLDYLMVDRVDQPPLDISFPALLNASSLYIQGNIHSLSMPRLHTIGEARNGDYYGTVKILTYGHPLNVSLPSLSRVGIMAVAGTIGSISLPSAINTRVYQVNTSTPLSIDLAPLQNITEYLQLYGNFTAVNMSSITDFGSMNIDSSHGDFHCGSIASDFERIKGKPYRYFECISPPPPSKTPLKLGLGIGLGVPILLAFVYYVFWKCRRTRKEQKLKYDTPHEYELGVPPMHATDGPPTFEAAGEKRSELGAGVVAGARTGDESSAREEGESVHGAGDAASARPGDGSSAHQEGASGRRAV